jgi:uncharacterized membrane protein
VPLAVVFVVVTAATAAAVVIVNTAVVIAVIAVVIVFVVPVVILVITAVVSVDITFFVRPAGELPHKQSILGPFYAVPFTQSITVPRMASQFTNDEEERISNSSHSSSLLYKVTAENQQKDSKRLRVILPQLSSVSNNAGLSTVVRNVVRQ